MKNYWKVIIMALVLTVSIQGFSQNILSRTMSVNVNWQRLEDVLEIISNKGNFYFSYNSTILRKDSLISISVSNRTVKEILDQILPDKYEYKESGDYLIIRRAPVRLTLVTNKAVAVNNYYLVSGYVLDDETGYMIRNASIYEKDQLASALTDQQGFFKLKLKNKAKTAAISVSKEFYEDTTVTIDPGYNQQISITIVPVDDKDRITIVRPEDYFLPDSLRITVSNDAGSKTYTYVRLDSGTVENTGFGNFLLSPRLKTQTANLRKFFTQKPFQLSVVPGLSNHGTLSGQIVNNFSLSVFGGYSAGVNGVELAGLFNLDKKNVRFLQMAGLFNIVGGSMKGAQLAGITNTVLDSVRGFQASGINNHVAGNYSGVQVAGIYNHVGGTVKGFQLAGVGNFARKKIEGSQVAGVVNFSNKEITGSQVSGVINYAKHIHGVQIGLINIADSSDGYSIGLINFVVHGYHKLSFSTNEFIPFNLAFKTGNRKFYSILLGGINWRRNDEKIYSAGYGLGSEMNIGKIFSVNPEISSQFVYLGSFDYTNLLNKFNLNLNFKLGKYVSLFGGPAFNVFYAQQTSTFAGYKSPSTPTGYQRYEFSNRVHGWIGWNAGISFF